MTTMWRSGAGAAAGRRSGIAARVAPAVMARNRRRVGLVIAQRQLQPQMAVDEAEAPIELVGLASRFVGGELHQPAALLLRPLDRMADERLAQPLAAVARVDPHPFDLRAPHPLAGAAGDDGQLQNAL